MREESQKKNARKAKRDQLSFVSFPDLRRNTHVAILVACASIPVSLSYLVLSQPQMDLSCILSLGRFLPDTLHSAGSQP
jgi:hypothetical protein